MKTILKLWIINLFIVFVISLFSTRFTGDFEEPIKISFLMKLIVFIILATQFFFAYIIAQTKLNIKTLNIDKNAMKKYMVLVLILVIINLVVLLITGIGKAGEVSNNKFVFLLNLLGVDTFFGVYYLLSLREEKRNGYFWIVWLIYLIYKIAQGWSGVIFGFFLIEVYNLVRKKKMKNGIGILYLLILLGGGLIYMFLFPLKMFIRTGIYLQINYIDSLEKLVSRLTPYNNLGYILQELYYFCDYTKDNLIQYSYIMDFFRRILPSFLFPYKDFDNTNRLLIKGLYGDKFLGSVDTTFFANTLFFFNNSIIDGILYIMMFIVLTIIIVFLSKRLDKQIMNLFIFNAVSGLMISGSFGVAYSMIVYNLILINIIFEFLLCKKIKFNIKYILKENGVKK